MVITYIYLKTTSTEGEAIRRIFNKRALRTHKQAESTHIPQLKTEAGLQTVLQPKTGFKNENSPRLRAVA